MDAVLGFIGTFLYYTWWLLLLFILGPLAADAWLAWRQKKFEHELKWTFLEILVPRETMKSPKAMEQVFNQLYQFKNYPGDIKEVWWNGEVTVYYSFEMVSLGGEIHLYMRVPQGYRSTIEAAIFGFYPDIEIVEAEDYMKKYPGTIQELYRDNMSLWGVEMELKKSGAYPIRSYLDFESPDEDKQYDPISAFMELLAKVQPGQMVAIQYIIWPAVSPHDSHEIKEYHHEVVKLREREHEKGHGHGGKSAFTKASFPGGPLPAFEIEAHHDEGPAPMIRHTPGESQVIEAIEDNLSMPMFSVMIRYIYISEQGTYSEHFARRGVSGLFNQFGSLDLNSFSRNEMTKTGAKIWEWPIIIPKIRKEFRRQRIYYDFRHREIPPHTFFGHFLMRVTSKFNLKKLKFEWGSHAIHLNTRSLATLYHPPTTMVLTGPHMPRVDSRKGGPPAGMAIFGDENDIERYT